jgi:transposase
MNVDRYGQRFKERAVARSLPPESGALEVVARDVGIGVGTLVRWREEMQSRLSPVRAWTADARLDAVITTASLDDAGKSAWCREHGVFTKELDSWRTTAMAALEGSVAMRTNAPSSRQDRLRIKELERNLLRKDRALAETAALLVLSKKVAAIFHKGEDE